MARREVEGGWGGHGYGSNHPQDLHMKVSIQIRILLLKDNYGIMVDVFFCFYLGIWGRGRGVCIKSRSLIGPVLGHTQVSA